MPLFLICGVSTPAYAQDAGSLLKDREQGLSPNLPKSLPEDQSEVLQAQPSSVQQSEEMVTIRTVRFTGKKELLSDGQRAQLAALVEDKKVGFSQLRSLAEATSTALRQNGYILARAVLPPQEATDGVLTIDIVEGQLGDISFNYGEQVRIRHGLIESIIDQHLDRQRLNKADLESALLRVGDLPGVTARSRLAPGTTNGTSNLVIDVTEQPVFAGSFFGDNFGSPSTGRAQGHAQLAFSDIAGIGDYSRLGLSISEGQRFLSASLSAPISSSGLSATIDYAYLTYKNQDVLGKAAGLDGNAHYGGVSLDYQAIRTRNANLRFSAALDGKTLVDDSTGGRLSDKRVLSGTLGMSGDVSDSFLGGSVTQLSLSWTMGDLDLSRVPFSELVDFLTLQTQGRFNRINVDMVRLQKLYGNFSLLTRMSGQWASKNLDSSESISLGGPYGVRGWPVGEGRGDMGLQGTMELRYDLPSPPKLGAFQLSAFVDAGRLRINENTNGIPFVNACSCNSYSLSSAGVGMSWQHKNFGLSASWAHGLGSNPGRNAFNGSNVDGDSDRQQFWLSGSIKF
ncbi:ShlB/FhaC/HecB family hemolysin secretion/activation protein [Parasphingorhabdus sp.]|uniref:ShlB/FhaC/HecB family hemolysin secretion/activation protein n=1 Tax=Parasphingorhabdus sp. TaxID=2709688 RepID=UPI003001BF8A